MAVMQGDIDVMGIYRQTGILPSFREGGQLTKRFLKKMKKRGISPEDISYNHFLDIGKEFVSRKNEHSAGKIIVEAAHIYTDHGISDDHRIGCVVGNFIHDLFTVTGYDVKNCAFIDDMLAPTHNPLGRKFDVDGYVGFLCENGFKPDDLRYESTLASHAEKLIDRFKQEGKVLNRDKKLYLYGRERNNVALSDGHNPSCALMDAVYHMERLESADYTVTVLPVKFKSEQSGMKKILKEAGGNPKKILSVFIDKASGAGVPDAFSDDSLTYIKTMNVALLHYFKNDLTQANLNGFLQYCKSNVVPFLKKGGINYKLPFDLSATTHIY